MADEEDVAVRRYPIMLTEHCIALITLFIKPYDRLDDLWTYDYLETAQNKPKFAAEEFVRQLEDQYTPAFLMALRKAITDKLKEDDKRYGTNFAERNE
jgi:hypothetical protein